MNPVALLLIALAIAFGSYNLGRAHESTQANQRMIDYRAKVHGREMDQQRALAEANNKAREQEKAHEQKVADLRAEYARASQQQADRDRRTIDDLHAGYQRLRLQVARNAADAQAGSAAAAAFGIDGDGRAELAPETAAALYAIAADGDTAIRRLTALQGWARSAVDLCGARPQE